jgi:hypothetical protein
LKKERIEMKVKIKTEHEMLYKGTLKIDTVYEVTDSQSFDYYQVDEYVPLGEHPKYVKKEHCVCVMKDLITITKEEYNDLVNRSAELRVLSTVLNDSPLRKFYPDKDIDITQKVVIAIANMVDYYTNYVKS